MEFKTFPFSRLIKGEDSILVFLGFFAILRLPIYQNDLKKGPYPLHIFYAIFLGPWWMIIHAREKMECVRLFEKISTDYSMNQCLIKIEQFSNHFRWLNLFLPGFPSNVVNDREYFDLLKEVTFVNFLKPKCVIMCILKIVSRSCWMCEYISASHWKWSIYIFTNIRNTF